jgi:pimeloyl-ACP methyl ester carboxylesterase
MSSSFPVWHERRREGVVLACADFGGVGGSALLLHGLAGHAGEWTETASWLSATDRVLAPDQRGHGKSERRPADLSRQAFVDDAAMWVRELAGRSALVIGQSLGGHTAFLLAAQYPELVKALVVAEASPEADPEAHSVAGDWLRSWPVPFPSREAALEFFGGYSPWSRAWTEGLEERSDGLWPSFDVDVMLACLDGGARSYWDEWARVLTLLAGSVTTFGDTPHRPIDLDLVAGQDLRQHGRGIPALHVAGPVQIVGRAATSRISDSERLTVRRPERLQKPGDSGPPGFESWQPAQSRAGVAPPIHGGRPD